MKKILKISLPESWNQLSDCQVKRLAMLFFSSKRDVLFDVTVLKILMDIRWWHFRKRVRLNLLLKDVALSELKKHYAFIYAAVNRTNFAHEMKTSQETFFAPQARLQNLSAVEFAVAEDLHKAWYKSGKRELLEYLAAVLYTTAPNIRPVFYKEELEAKASLFKRVPLVELMAMELTYRGCKEYIATRYPRVFPVVKSDSKKSYGPGFGKVIHAMAGGKFGDHEKTKRTNIYEFLDEVEENLKPKNKNG